MQYKDYTARRRIVSFGGQYDFAKQTLQPANGPPPELTPLLRKSAAWQHSIEPTAQMRYSITFRTKRSFPGTV